MEEKVKEIVEIKQRSLAEENQKTLEVLKERYLVILSAVANCLLIQFSTCDNCLRYMFVAFLVSYHCQSGL